MNTITSSNRKLTNVIYLSLFLLSYIFLFFFSKGTSPLYYHTFYGHDGAIFILLGQLLLDGKIPYVDFFDHKGPVLIFIEALGQSLIYGKTGIFILQGINMFFILTFIYKTSIIFTKSLIQNTIIIFSFLFFFRFTMSEGNLNEEYCLLYLVVSIYITISFYFTNSSLNRWKTVILGLCFSIPFWIRANNVGIVCACILFICYILIKRKEWESLKEFITIFFLTFILFSSVICIYYYYRGALYEMIDATFLFNIKYAVKPVIYKRIFTLFLIFSIVVAFVFIIGNFFLLKKKWDKGLFIFSLLLFFFGFASIWVGSFFSHYLTIIIPLFLLGIMFFFNSGKYAGLLKKLSPYILIILIIGLITSLLFYKKFENNADVEYSRIVHSLIDHIPEQELNEIYGYRVSPRFYLITGIKPIYKYFVLQESHGSYNPEILEDINTMITEKKPRWIITEKAPSEEFSNKDFLDILSENYSQIDEKRDSRKMLVLYRLKQDK